MKLVAWCKDCDAALETGAEPWAPRRCPECSRTYELDPSPLLREGRSVDRCALCGYAHLHIRKDFPRQLGLAIVLVAAVLTFTPICPPGFFFLPLIVASAIDLLLYQVIPWKVVCYVCDAEYRGARPLPDQVAFDLATATEHNRLKWPKPRAETGAAPGA